MRFRFALLWVVLKSAVGPNHFLYFATNFIFVNYFRYGWLFFVQLTPLNLVWRPYVPILWNNNGIGLFSSNSHSFLEREKIFCKRKLQSKYVVFALSQSSMKIVKSYVIIFSFIILKMFISHKKSIEDDSKGVIHKQCGYGIGDGVSPLSIFSH